MKARACTSWVLGSFAAVALAGCASFDDWASGSSSKSKQPSPEFTYLDQQLKALTERVAGLEQSSLNLQRDLNDVKGRLDQLQSGAGNQASATELQQLRAQVQAIDAQREKDKQAILDQVAKELAGIASARRAATARTTSSSPNEVGYEHEVQAGESLFVIGKTYGVSVAAIKKANNLSSDNIRVGQKLFIPKAP